MKPTIKATLYTASKGQNSCLSSHGLLIFMEETIQILVLLKLYNKGGLQKWWMSPHAGGNRIVSESKCSFPKKDLIQKGFLKDFFCVPQFLFTFVV